MINDLQLSCNFQIRQFKSFMYEYYVDTLERNYDPENHDPGKQSLRHVAFHVTCLSVSVVVFNCHMKFYCFLHIF